MTMGDGLGIGPEVTLRTILDHSIKRRADLIVIGDARSIESAARMLKKRARLNKIPFDDIISSSKLPVDPKSINIIDLGGMGLKRAPIHYLDAALTLIRKRIAHALVTAPVNKEALTRSAGFKFTGHTEYLAEQAGAKRIAMMFAGGVLKVTAVTRHIPLKSVARHLTSRKIVDAALLTERFLIKDLKIKRPRIGVVALNPHAGDGGTIGDEEKRIIIPAIKRLEKKIGRVRGADPSR